VPLDAPDLPGKDFLMGVRGESDVGVHFSALLQDLLEILDSDLFISALKETVDNAFNLLHYSVVSRVFVVASSSSRLSADGVELGTSVAGGEGGGRRGGDEVSPLAKRCDISVDRMEAGMGLRTWERDHGGQAGDAVGGGGEEAEAEVEEEVEYVERPLIKIVPAVSNLFVSIMQPYQDPSTGASTSFGQCVQASPHCKGLFEAVFSNTA
jgi:hypothetical protein